MNIKNNGLSLLPIHTGDICKKDIKAKFIYTH